MKFKAIGVLGAVAAAALTLTSCSGGGAGGNGTINYWLWDATQKPAYQACADDFHKANPDITVKITQLGWDDYWTKLTNGMAAGNAPDVFTDHLTKYPDFVKTKQLLPMDDLKVDYHAYNDGLADLWVAPDGKRYGTPKDWDTIALFYNKKMVADAGMTADQMGKLTWNPDDGGTYEKAIAHLTLDKNGKRGDEPGFDKNNVAVYGFGFDASGGRMGQTQWSFLTATTGWTHTDKTPWGTHYNYDDPRFQKTIAWYAALVDKGYMAKLETTIGASAADTFGAGKSAIISNGDWMVDKYLSYQGLDLGIAQTPIGPNDKSMSMYNGLADSIWAGTKNKADAEKWVGYLASDACQNVVGQKGVVFPASKSGTEKAIEAFKAKGIDPTPFTSHVADKTTFLAPVTDAGQKIDGIMTPAMDAVMTGQKPASSLTDANNQVNALLGK